MDALFNQSEDLRFVKALNANKIQIKAESIKTESIARIVNSFVQREEISFG